MKKNSRKTFIVCACIGFIVSLIKIVVDTVNADITTIQAALSNLEQLKPLESLNTITFFYLCIAVVPILMAMCFGVLGIVVEHGVLFFRKQINTKGETIMKPTVFEDPCPKSGRSMQEYIDSHFGHSTDDDEDE